ncbi:MAG: hypothetical protein R3C01_09700 [Planctomycetaceae bacterium]
MRLFYLKPVWHRSGDIGLVPLRLTIFALLFSWSCLGGMSSLVAADKVWEKVDKIIDVNFSETPFDDAMAEMSKKIGVPIRLDEDGLDDVGAPARVKVSAGFSQMTGGALLSLILEERGLTWTIEEEGLAITSIERMEAAFRTETHSLLTLGAIGRNSKELAEVLQEVTEGIEGMHWKSPDDDEAEGTLVAEPGRLSVTQHRAGQEVIADALRQVRRAVSKRSFPLTQHEQADVYLKNLLAKEASCDFQKQPLDAAVRAIAKQYRVPNWINYASLSRHEVHHDTPVTLTVDKAPLSELMDRLLHESDLEWGIRDEVVYIAAREEYESYAELQIVNVSKLLISHGGAAQLIKEVQELDPKSTWGAEGGKVRELGGLLFIRQTPSTQRQIGKFLNSGS